MTFLQPGGKINAALDGRAIRCSGACRTAPVIGRGFHGPGSARVVNAYHSTSSQQVIQMQGEGGLGRADIDIDRLIEDRIVGNSGIQDRSGTAGDVGKDDDANGNRIAGAKIRSIAADGVANNAVAVQVLPGDMAMNIDAA